MSGRSHKRTNGMMAKRWFVGKAALFLTVIVALAAAAVWQFREPRQDPQPPAAQEFPLPEIAPTPFRNAASSVAHVGTSRCVGCHRGKHRSYLKTKHSRSLSEIDVAHEPPDGRLEHKLSGRNYRVDRDGNTLRLRELVRDADGDEVVLADHTAALALGSGNFVRMYLVQVKDFLVESPMSWYPRRNRWGMSAGYAKNPLQPGFVRATGVSCLHCHAGHVEQVGRAGERVKIVELAIGCENCHGRGELHVRERSAELPVQGSFDDTIVNPRHLPRERQEDVCAQCHLAAAADVTVRGRSKADFRPGMRMSDFVASYHFERPNSAMTVTGQIEQMRLSRCYVESKTLTCATCHNMHAPPEKAQKVEHYRNKCLSCHETDSCGLTIKARVEKEADDNCVVCHMPRSQTDIPHLAFAHHRIGIHDSKPKNKLSESDRIVAMTDVSRFPEHERLRQLGLANDVFAAKLSGGLDDETRYDPSYLALVPVFQNRARQLFEKVRAMGLRDPNVEDFFSRVNWKRRPELSIEHAQLALQAERISPEIRGSALYLLASSHFDNGRYDAAVPYLEELVRSQRNEIPVMLLAICREKMGNFPEAERLVKEAILIRPQRADLHTHLASLYRRIGKNKEAEPHVKMAATLRRNVPQPK